ncbi:protein FAM13A isoform X2 [Strongylocentrotus purpuratus]|nr:protein FAM13A isoform X2 [Strongylocentrotus purpuratus]
MQKILRSPASIRRKVVNKMFGVPLKELCRYGPNGIRIPELLQKIIEFIKMHGIGHEGIFRINGSSKIVEKLRMQYDRHGNANLEEAGDVMAVASLLKLFFRELPDPVVIGQLHPQFLTVQEEFQYNKEESLKQLKNLLQQLPEENFLVLRYLCSFLIKVIHHEDTNKMNSMALAIVFGPNLFRCADGIQGLREQGQTNHLVRLFIDKFDFLFGHDGGSYSPPSPVNAINGSGRVWNSKRIEVQAAKEKKSPPFTPLPHAQYMKQRRTKLALQEEVDLNSNYSEVSKEDSSSGSPQNHGYLSIPDGEYEERAFSPFTLDSDQGTSAAPSPVTSSITSELVERTIQESISQHLFGARGSPRLDLSPRQETPVAMPRKKHQKKNQDSSSFNRRSNSESSLEHLVNSFAEREGISVKNRAQQFSDDTLVSSKSHDQSHPVRRKGRPASKAFDIFESQGIIIGQRLVDSSSVSEGLSREGTLTDVTHDGESELDSVKRNSGTLNSLTAGRVAPPKRRSPTKKHRSAKGEHSLDSPNGKEKAAKRSNNSDFRTQNHDVWLRQNGDGQRSPSNGGSRNPREGGLWGVHNNIDTPQHREQPVPQPRTRRGKAKDDEMDEASRRRTEGVSEGHGDRRRTEGDERRHDGGEARRMNERGGDGRRRDEEMRDGRMEDELRRLKGEDRKNPSPNSLRGQVVPPLDLAGLHVDTDGHEAVLAWQSQQAAPKSGGGGGGEGEGQSGMEGGPQTLSRLEKLQTITSLLQHEPYDAPLSPRAKDAPPTFGSGSWDTLEGPPSPVSKHDMFPRFVPSSKRSESSLDEEDQVSIIRRLTRQVRSLKQKIKQYEEEFESQYHAKPSHTEKLSQPEIRKMIGELKRATKQLKALKTEAKESKNPLHSTLPARLSPNGVEEGSHLSGLKEALNLAQKRLQEKRDDAKRGFDVLEMNQDEVREEKVAIQKALLQLESKYGRPTSRASKEVMKPLYDRYRTLKKLMKNKELRRSISEEASPSDLNTIEEHVETRDFIPKHMGFVHSKYDMEGEEENEEDDMFCTTDFRVTQMVSPSQRSSGRSPSDHDDVCVSPNDSYRNDSPFSPASASFHEASLEELQTRRDQSLDEKRRLRRVLKDFEENFLHETGQRVQKEDRSPMEMEYVQYKHVKKQLKLLNALIAKHQSQTLAAVT